jgi:hypothetical protein
MTSMKSQAPKVPPHKDEFRVGFPGDAKRFRARVRAAIAANRETLRCFAK